MDTYEKNLEALEKDALYLYSNMEYVNFENNASDDFIISEALNRELITSIQTKDNLIRLNSLYNPSNEASCWADQYSILNSNCTQRTFFVFGLGNGYFVRELLKVIRETECVVVYEPNYGMFMNTLKYYDITDIIGNPNVFLVVDQINYMDLEKVLSRHQFSIMFGQFTIVSIPYYSDLYREKMSWFFSVYQNVYISSIVDSNTAVFHGEKWADAEIENIIPTLEGDFIEEYKGILPNDIPVIIVASGPSLSKNVSMIRKAKGKALILAVDSSVKYLEKHAIQPDFIVTLDVKKSVTHFQNSIAIETPMIASTASNPNVLNMNKAKKIFFEDNLNLKKFKGIDTKKMSIAGAGSVATAAFEIAAYMGAKTIILVGQDLAFDGNSSHAMGERRQDNISREYIELVEGNDGSLLKTRFDWYTYLCWYNERVKRFEGKVVNATEGGAKIEGTEITTLDDAINKYCISQIDMSIFKINDTTVYEKVLDKRLAVEIVDNLKNEFKEVDKYVDEALLLIEKLLKENVNNVIESNSMIRNSKR
ncbi:motility associated factor glycosyltransferase family protein, partial [Anaerosporobacter sp.]